MKIKIFDTTMRDGELMPGVQFNLGQKVQLAILLEKIGVDVIEVGYPGAFAKDFDEITAIAHLLKTATLCGLAGSQANEIERAATALKPAAQGRINIFTNVRLLDSTPIHQAQTLDMIRASVTLARSYCPDVQWSAFDTVRSHPDFLCRAVETAIAGGATTISLPDSLGTASPEEFCQLLERIFNQVANLERAVVAVHCHDDRGRAVENSLAALGCGVRQIECSVNGLGAKRGNADLGTIVKQLSRAPDYQVDVDTTLLDTASALVAQMTMTQCHSA